MPTVTPSVTAATVAPGDAVPITLTLSAAFTTPTPVNIANTGASVSAPSSVLFGTGSLTAGFTATIGSGTGTGNLDYSGAGTTETSGTVFTISAASPPPPPPTTASPPPPPSTSPPPPPSTSPPPPPPSTSPPPPPPPATLPPPPPPPPYSPAPPITGTTVTLGGVEGEILVDRYVKAVAHGEGPKRMVRYLVPWDGSDIFIDKLMGSVRVLRAGGASVTFPAPHPYPGDANLYCLSAECDEQAGPGMPDVIYGRLIRFDRAIVTATYGCYPFDLDGSQAGATFDGATPVPFSSSRVRGYRETVQVSRGALRDLAGNPVPGTDRTIDWDISLKEFEFTRHFMPTMWADVLDPIRGCVNYEPMWGQDRGTLVFDQYDTNDDRDSDGNSVQTITMRFRGRQFDWNAEPSIDDGGFVVVKLASGKFRYPYANLNIVNSLFT